MFGRRRWSWLIALGAAVTLVAAACNGEEAAPPDTDDTDQEIDLSGETLEVAATWSGSEQENFEREVIGTFEEETGATVNFTSTGDDIAAVIGPRVEGGEPPDIALLPQPGLLVDFANQGTLVDIEEAAGDAVDENYADIWRELGTHDGTLYGVWWKAANKSTVWYNINVFENAGVEPPEDWDGMLDVAQTISDFGVDPFVIGGASGWVLSDWFENIYIRTAGPEAYDQLTEHEIPWTDDTVVQALETFAEIVGQPNLLAGGTDGTLNTDFDTSIQVAFANPQSPDAAILYEGDFVGGILSDETESEVGTDADFFDFPSIEGSPPAVVGGGDVAVLMVDSEAGQEFIRYLATPEASAAMAGGGGFTSPNQNVDLGAYPDDITRRSAEALVEAGDAFRFDLSDLQPAEFGSTEGQGIWGILQDFVRNPDDAQGAAQQLEEAASRAFG